MRLLNLFCRKQKKEVVVKEVVKETIDLSKQDRQKAIYTATLHYLLKGGKFKLIEHDDFGMKWRVDLKQETTLITKQSRILVADITKVMALSESIYYQVLDLKGESLGLTNLYLGKVEALALIKEVGAEHKLAQEIIEQSVNQFKVDIEDRQGLGSRERQMSKVITYKDYVFSFSSETMFVALSIGVKV